MVIFGSIFGLIRLVSQSPNNQNAAISTNETGRGWIKGNSDAKTTLVEYSDFQCPACAHYYPVIKKLTAEFGNEIKFVYRHFPLKTVHKNARIAAIAAEAAGIQGNFWEMHDILFENQQSWAETNNLQEVFVKYAANLGLNIEKFKADLASSEIKDKVDNDYGSGRMSGVNSTPTFFLNGEKLKNPASYEEFRQIITEAISNSPQ